MSQEHKLRIAIVGYGNIGRYALEALQTAPDMTIAGVVRRDPTDIPPELRPYRVVGNVRELGQIDVALLCTPTRLVGETAEELLALGINTVDSYDLHGGIVALRARLGEVARASGAVAIISAGWDPGSDSVIRTLMEAMVPRGITYTNFGPGMSMGHTVAVKAIAGVRKALSMTIPTGTGIHRRMVYVELEEGYEREAVVSAIKADEYFVRDETHVQVVGDVDALIDVGHGVEMSRKGVSGKTHNQLLEFGMRINNPALTAQILVASARATMRQRAGCYTLQEVPLIDLLPGEREQWIEKLC